VAKSLRAPSVQALQSVSCNQKRQRKEDART
jgi:hypothetical protein